jgi:GH15 family glucan-1,4-alpha-glucosidase
LGRASELGLYGEEFAAAGMLGNVPQAFTHLALIQAAANIEAGPPIAIVADMTGRRSAARC